MQEIHHWDHAHVRMRQRRITAHEVESVIESPMITYPGNVAGRRVLIGHPGGRFIKVVIVEGTDPIQVVTVAD
jgi:hypothetical protein